ncbi:hypothetical protein ABT56_11995 [Photobacterium aquae]|uniref:Uncharacterized protein n=2 Tax=Photobacterium aquae TaxID=1195763 RepID=A0A0J1H0T3_9GAMM|nr:hypothetical protein ABT56_11995 [Photobacterium aquae]
MINIKGNGDTMDQADTLRHFFARQESRNHLERCIEEVRDSIRDGNFTLLNYQLNELEKAQLDFESFEE